MSEFETENTGSIVCPYCGHTHKDSWEYNDWSDTRINCHSCEKAFELHVEVTVEYTTERVETRLARELRAHLNSTPTLEAHFRVACIVADYGLENMPVGFLEALLGSFK